MSLSWLQMTFRYLLIIYQKATIGFNLYAIEGFKHKEIALMLGILMKEPQNRNYLMPERFCNKLMQQKNYDYGAK
jgi:hypothetical protein